MFCVKCGNSVNDGAKYCSRCGALIQINAVKNETAEATNIETTNIEITNIETTSDKTNTPSVSNVKSSLLMKVVSIAFALLTIAACVCEMTEGSIQDIARLIEIIVATIMIMCFTLINTKTAYILKGIALLMFVFADIIFVGFDTVKYTVDSVFHSTEVLAAFFDVSEAMIITYFVVVLTAIIFMYLFMMLDSIRSFGCKTEGKLIPVTLGMMAAIATILQILLKYKIQGDIELYMGFVPQGILYVFLCLSLVFSILSKKRTENNQNLPV